MRNRFEERNGWNQVNFMKVRVMARSEPTLALPQTVDLSYALVRLAWRDIVLWPRPEGCFRWLQKGASDVAV